MTNDGVISASQTSTFGGAILIEGATDETVTNAGVISGPTALDVETGSSATIQNSGTIEGSVALADTSMLDIENAGLIQATSLDFLSSANNVLTNSGKVHAQIDMGTGEDQIYNTGAIAGQIDFAGGSDTLINDGEIHGSVTMGSNDQVINTGAIRGNVFLGNGDTLTAGPGLVTGFVEPPTRILSISADRSDTARSQAFLARAANTTPSILRATISRVMPRFRRIWRRWARTSSSRWMPPTRSSCSTLRWRI